LNATHRRFRRLILTLSLLGAWSPAMPNAAATPFPQRPVKLIVPYSPGGASEVAVRAVAEGMARALGQPVLIDNRPGADGAIAVQAGIAAEADGHTLVLVAASMVSLPMSVKPPPFDMADLMPVSTLGDVTFGLFVPASLPVKTTRELLAYASAQGQPLAYASILPAMDALSSALASAAGVEMTRVPYKGGAQAMTDLVGGRLQVFIGPIGNGLAATQEGRLRLLATHPQRTPLAPGVPTLVESGVGAATTPMFMLLAAPARTPRPVVARLAQAIDAALREPQVRERLESLGVAGMASSPEAAAEQVRRAQQAYAAVVQRLEAAHGRSK
jgi:tripartite-type tricarboxylate transporter receptor subunit TctC